VDFKPNVSVHKALESGKNRKLYVLVLKEDIGAYTLVWPVNFWKKLPAKSGIIASSLNEDFKTKKVDSERDERRVSRDKEKKLPADGKVAPDIATQAQVAGPGWFSSPAGVNANNPFKPGGSIFAGQTGSIFSKPQNQSEMSKRPARKTEKNEASPQGFMLNSKPKYQQTPVVGEDETLKILGRLGETLCSPGFQSQGQDHTSRTAFSEFVSPGILATGQQPQISQAKYPWESPWAGALTPSTQVSSSPFVQNQNPFHSAKNAPISSFSSNPQTPVMISIPQNKWSSGVNSYGIPESPDPDTHLQPADKPIDNPFAKFNDNPPDALPSPTLTGQNFLNLKKTPDLPDHQTSPNHQTTTLQSPLPTPNPPYQPPNPRPPGPMDPKPTKDYPKVYPDLPIIFGQKKSG
jgi:hypothetical protein